MTDRGYKIVITAMLVLAAFAVMLNIFLWEADESFEGSIKVRDNGVTETVIPVRDLVMVPGVKQDYEVDLVCEASGSYIINLEYEEERDGGLKHFVVTTVLMDGEEIYNGPLTDLIDNNQPIEFEEELNATEPVVLTFIYEMSVDTGNEAMGTSADFMIHVVIEKS